MRRYDKTRRRDREELEARLSALQPRNKGRRRRRRSNPGPLVLGLLLIVGTIGALYYVFSAALGGDESAGKPVRIEVAQGDTLSSVAEKLEEKGVIGNAFLFKLEARLSGESAEIKPGRYTFVPGEDDEKIMQKLTSGKAVPTFAVTIPEGLTIEQTAEQVARHSDITVQEFVNAARSTDYGYAFLQDPAVKTTEGYLFPKRYEFEEGTDARGVVNRLLEQYLIETEGVDFEEAGQRLNLSEHEIVTVASLIEREAATSAERPVIASVIYNRLREGMPLQIDATIQYARGEPKENLSLQDLEIDSPYNTYENPGLPPGPICSPSLESIEAAVNPADTDYLYYVLDASGEKHTFHENYDDFLQAKAEAGR